MNAPDDPRAVVFDVQRFSVHDGPGIRTLVFFKGCPLRCPWCCNPESQSSAPELALFPERCIGCSRCVSSCAREAIGRDEAGRLTLDRGKCVVCGSCASACPANARVVFGREVTVEDLMQVIRRDFHFYRASGGGVTLGGGEVTVWSRFASRLLAQCRREGIGTAIETSGYSPWPNLKVVASQCDLVLFDIKHIDSVRHKEFTGVPNRLILDNFARLAGIGTRLIVRIPVVPGFNDDETVLRGIASFVRKTAGDTPVELLAYHRLGELKYGRLGRRYEWSGTEPPAEELMQRLAEAVREAGLRCKVGA